MKFEVKTQNDDIPKSYTTFFLTFVIISFIIILSNISIKLGMISRYYNINYQCKLLLGEKSSSHFRKLSKSTKIKSKQKMVDLCRELSK